MSRQVLKPIKKKWLVKTGEKNKQGEPIYTTSCSIDTCMKASFRDLSDGERSIHLCKSHYEFLEKCFQKYMYPIFKIGTKLKISATGGSYKTLIYTGIFDGEQYEFIVLKNPQIETIDDLDERKSKRLEKNAYIPRASIFNIEVLEE